MVKDIKLYKESFKEDRMHKKDIENIFKQTDEIKKKQKY